MKLVLLISALTILVKNAMAHDTDGQCTPWRCQEGLGGDLERENRTCASKSGNLFVAEECSPIHYLCEVGQVVEGDKNCSSVAVLDWRKGMPAGDDCYGNSSCADGINCGIVDNNHRCIGRAQGATCENDKQCNPGLYCHHTGSGKTNQCTPVLQLDDTCDEHQRCEFGTACINRRCTRFGTLADGAQYEIFDEEVLPSPTETHRNEYFRPCESFFAFDTKMRSDDGKRVIYECTGNFQKNFTDYRRSGDNLTCDFAIFAANGTLIEPQQHTAQCGWNRDNYFYCPKRREAEEFRTGNSIARDAWRVNATACHHRSTIQYCPTIQDNFITQRAFLEVLRLEWITEGDNFPKIAANDRCVGNAISTTRNYWRMIDSAQSTLTGFFVLIVGVVMSFTAF